MTLNMIPQISFQENVKHFLISLKYDVCFKVGRHAIVAPLAKSGATILLMMSRHVAVVSVRGDMGPGLKSTKLLQPDMFIR